MAYRLNFTNLHLHGDLWSSSFRLRHRVFIKLLRWDVGHVRQMEYDQYDTPGAEYIIVADEQNQAVGMARLLPTTRPYMLSDLWPDLLDQDTHVAEDAVWEVTRFCVDPWLPGEDQLRVMQELTAACLDFALERDLRGLLAITYPKTWEELKMIGLEHHLIAETVFDRRTCQSAWCPVTEVVRDRIYSRAGFTHPQLKHFAVPEAPAFNARRRRAAA